MRSLPRVLLLAAFLAGNALADDNSVKRAFEARFAGLRVESVAKTPFNGLYELVIGDEIVYTDERATFVINGSVIDARTKRNFTEERLQKLGTIKFDTLPLELAIKTVRGNGKRVVAIFADPYCPYCKALDQAMQQLDNVTVYTLWMDPVLNEKAYIMPGLGDAGDRLNGKDTDELPRNMIQLLGDYGPNILSLYRSQVRKIEKTILG